MTNGECRTGSLTGSELAAYHKGKDAIERSTLCILAIVIDARTSINGAVHIIIKPALNTAVNTSYATSRSCACSQVGCPLMLAHCLPLEFERPLSYTSLPYARKIAR